ncbi:MAG TPA: PhoH family protein [Spirochaetales bacterium]|nr:PhoH family protein [Spirochaetales bacterium]HPB66078.1 PhoH family protein [Spirochaetales bacterium]HPG85795.1 PhoH family protein [Spirochaetales bacterium]
MVPTAAVGIALDDTRLLADVCGVNDYNLRVLERLLGVPVFVRGNEISLESPRPDVRELFAAVIEQLLSSIDDGLPASPELITAIHASLTPDGQAAPSGASFKDSAIQVPGAFSKVYPRTANQALYLRGLSSHDISVAVGPAGTGKTYLAVAWALREVLSKARRRLVLTRPVVEAGESLGFLPGDLGQKISPYLRPLYDAMEALVPYDVVKRLEDNHTIEIAPLAYMRGRSLNNCVVILDEAQNTTKEQMKMFLTRLGEGSVAVVTGDATQIDLPRKSESGLVHALKVLSDIDDIFVCRLDGRDVVRNPLVRKIIDAYESEI